MFLPFVVVGELRRPDHAPLRKGLSAAPKPGHAHSTNDLWIAALVLQYDLVPHDRDRHFEHLSQILRI
jgi:predicted nucleic acid-binding protein